MKRTNCRADGFSLLEVLLALGILVAAVAILSRLVLIGVESARFSRLQAAGLNLAENRMEEFDAGILTVDDAGTFASEEYPGWSTTLSVADAGVEFLKVVTIEARKSDSMGPSPVVRLSRYYFDRDEASEATQSTTGGTTP